MSFLPTPTPHHADHSEFDERIHDAQMRKQKIWDSLSKERLEKRHQRREYDSALRELDAIKVEASRLEQNKKATGRRWSSRILARKYLKQLKDAYKRYDAALIKYRVADWTYEKA